MKHLYRIFGFSVLFFMLTVPSLFAQAPASGENEYRLSAINPRATTVDTITADAGRGLTVAVNPDLDGDGKPEIIVTDYQMGGRVFVYEVVGNDKLEFIWASPPIDSTRSGGGSTPRSVTTGDFDNDGKPEIIFPLGYVASDSAQFATRGIYFYEWTGQDNDFGDTAAFILRYEDIDTNFRTVNVGRTENSFVVDDIDGDGKNELLFTPRAFSFPVANLYILQVDSGTFENHNAVVDTEYVYRAMETVAHFNNIDGYVPVGAEVGDVDGDGLDEIIVTGWTNISSGAGLGFIEIQGPDQYRDGSILPLTDDFSAFVVKGKARFMEVNGEPKVFVFGGYGSNTRLWVIDGVVADDFVTDANLYTAVQNVGAWGVWDLGDQDHPTDDQGDGFDAYIGGGPRIYDVEYDGSGAVTDSNSYSIKQIYDLSKAYTTVGGLFNEIYTYPGMDLDNDGNRDFVAAYKGWSGDSIPGESLAKNGFHVFFFEWGDSATSINPADPTTGFTLKELTVITPDDYKLEQNYPNPFNPSTTIRFTLPISKTISLRIYNSLGQEVRTLINNESLPAGTHSVVWDGRDNNGNPVASGIYIYKLQFGNFSKSRKMMLVK